MLVIEPIVSRCYFLFEILDKRQFSPDVSKINRLVVFVIVSEYYFVCASSLLCLLKLKKNTYVNEECSSNQEKN